jgi:hypothetical protein
MNGFTVYAVGVLARNPELVVREEETLARFCLVGTDFKEVGEAVREYVTSVWFVAPEPVGRVARELLRRFTISFAICEQRIHPFDAHPTMLIMALADPPL